MLSLLQDLIIGLENYPISWISATAAAAVATVAASPYKSRAQIAQAPQQGRQETGYETPRVTLLLIVLFSFDRRL